MPDYRRARHPGGIYFFTVALLKRNGNDVLTRHIALLRQSVAQVRRAHPFIIHAWVVLPEHLHCVLEFPHGDANYTLRWRLIKAFFARNLPAVEFHSEIRRRRGERGIWQRRIWEHLIRDEADYRAHMNYVHFNPVRHGLVERVRDWPYSTFHRCVERGVYPMDWGGGDSVDAVECGE
ncbi:MAG: transposase [Gammaproteobacteria bacterium]|nr:transposase [Gammaproteobacteria bacterium]